MTTQHPAYASATFNKGRIESHSQDTKTNPNRQYIDRGQRNESECMKMRTFRDPWYGEKRHDTYSGYTTDGSDCSEKSNGRRFYQNLDRVSNPCSDLSLRPAENGQKGFTGKSKSQKQYPILSLCACRMLHMRDFPTRGVALGLGHLGQRPTLGLSPDRWLASPTYGSHATHMAHQACLPSPSSLNDKPHHV